MTRVLGVVWTIAAAAALLWLASRILEPMPVPAVTGVLGGAGLFWLARRRRALWSILGAAGGIIVGAAIHVQVHMSEDRMGEGALAHIATDAAVGGAIATVILCIAILPPALAGRVT